MNTAILAITWYDKPQNLNNILDIINYVFAGIFTVEAIVKLIAYSYHYFKDGWNVFDFTIVVGTLISIVVSLTTGLSVGPQATII